MAATSHGFSKNSQILVYVMPVGNMSPRMYMEGVKMLQASSDIPMSSLTRPGGYSSELSPFRSLSWDSSTSFVYRFEDTTSNASSVSTPVPCEDVHAWNRPLAILGLCHCPSTANLRDAYTDFKRVAANYPSAILQKVYAFEHAFGDGTLDDVSALDDLVMFPLAAPLTDGHTTVSLHLQVVLDAMTVTILMSLESTVRGVLRQHQQQQAASTDLSESVFGLLNTHIDPPSFTLASSVPPAFLGTTTTGSSTTPLRTGSGNSTLIPRPSGVSNAASAMDLSGGGTSLHGASSRKVGRSSARYRQEKLVADYALLVGCVADAMEFYATAIDGLRDEEKRASNAARVHTTNGDGLWLAAALEGYITALYLTMQRQKGGNGVQFNVELIEKASEAAAWYAKVGCVDLEAMLVASMGWYYAELVDDPPLLMPNRRRSDRPQRADEAEWIRRLCIESHDRLLSIPRPVDNRTGPTVPSQLLIKQVLELARQSRRIGYTRKELLYALHASALLCQSGSRPASASLLAAPSGPREMTLLAAYALLQQVLHGLTTTQTGHTTRNPDVERSGGWRRLRFYVLRQLIVVARKLRRPEAVARHALDLLNLLAHSPIAIESADAIGGSILWNDHVFTTIHDPVDVAGLKSRGQLHAAPTVYAAPPVSMEKEMKKAAAMLFQHHTSTMSLLSSSYFKNLPLLASSNHGTMPSAASGSTTPRLVLSTPRQLMSAVMSGTPSASSTSSFFDASDDAMDGADPPAPSPSTAARRLSTDNGSVATSSSAIRRHDSVNLHARNHITQWQHACWRLLHDESAASRPSASGVASTWTIQLPLAKNNGVLHIHRFGLSTQTTSRLRRLDHVTEIVQRSGVAASLPPRSTFIYNPFQAKDAKPSASPDNTPCPLHDSIQLDLVVDNQLEISVFVPHVTAWIQSDAGDHSNAQCVPAALQLAPRQRRAVVQITVRPTQVGRLVVVGCVLRLKHQTLRYALERPVVLEIVPPLPTIDFGPSPAPWSMFENEQKQFSVHATNSTGLDATHVFIDMTVVVQSSTKCAATGCIALANSLQLDDDAPRPSSHKVSVAGADVAIVLSPAWTHRDRGIAARSSVSMDVSLSCRRPCTIEMQLRAVYCHASTHKKLYRESTTTLSITCEPAVCISSVVALPASQDGRAMVVADLWNPSTTTRFHVSGDDNVVDVSPQCVRRALLPAAALHAPLTWTTSASSGKVALVSASSSPAKVVPWSVHVALEGHPCDFMLATLPLHSFERVVVTLTSTDHIAVLPLLEIEIQLFEQAPNITRALERTDKLIVAGQLEFKPHAAVKHHAVHVMAMASGVFQVRCVGRWKRADDSWEHVESPTLMLQTV
ncbi:hypothetical protein H310_11503 [Aphanomyces invadans]|uniref:Trs120/TRAPPC9 N-terminal domain-containing protein n=1 Tax=Aphanomyces invadans TaxID=157072 RepID=A0A024TNC4_9STRA|nr:hypothetical protein H310_11503 [Aphanomyces invadans]ETV94837.1 hypothetical protein H310_11503 [Aphanomyces invadans]|eukprot:XP_008876428.1 hypothetical protein H310_11503 [Aphanomyces invadans]